MSRAFPYVQLARGERGAPTLWLDTRPFGEVGRGLAPPRLFRRAPEVQGASRHAGRLLQMARRVLADAWPELRDVPVPACWFRGPRPPASAGLGALAVAAARMRDRHWPGHRCDMDPSRAWDEGFESVVLPWPMREVRTLRRAAAWETFGEEEAWRCLLGTVAAWRYEARRAAMELMRAVWLAALPHAPDVDRWWEWADGERDYARELRGACLDWQRERAAAWNKQQSRLPRRGRQLELRLEAAS